MSKSKALSIILPESKPEQIEALLTAFSGMEEIHDRLSLIFRAMQGACLVRLQDEYGFTRGNHGTAKTTACGFSSWPDLVKGKFGFSDERARRRINLWRAMEPLFKKLSEADRERFFDFLRRPQLHMTAPEVKVLRALSHKITTAETEHEFMLERGYLKAARKAPTKDDPSNNGSGNDTPAPTPELLIQDELFLPICGGGDGSLPTIWEPFDKLVKAWNKPLKDGGVKAPLWQFTDDKKKRELLRHLKTGREVTVRKLDAMIAQIEESLK